MYVIVHPAKLFRNEHKKCAIFICFDLKKCMYLKIICEILDSRLCVSYVLYNTHVLVRHSYVLLNISGCVFFKDTY